MEVALAGVIFLVTYALIAVFFAGYATLSSNAEGALASLLTMFPLSAPLVLPAVLHKGVHYFDSEHERGPRWYRSHFPGRGARVPRRGVVQQPCDHGRAKVVGDLLQNGPSVEFATLSLKPVRKRVS